MQSRPQAIWSLTGGAGPALVYFFVANPRCVSGAMRFFSITTQLIHTAHKNTRTPPPPPTSGCRTSTYSRLHGDATRHRSVPDQQNDMNPIQIFRLLRLPTSI
jgi:hypothetical protein